MLQGATFDNQIVKAKNDGGFYQRLLSDGALTGCAVTYTPTTINIAEGQIICGGRIIPNVGNHPISVTSTQDGYLRAILQIDLNAAATETDFEQVTTLYDMSLSEQFAPLTQEDINADGTLYQMELGIFRLVSGQIAEAVRVLDKAAPIEYQTSNATAAIESNTLQITSKAIHPLNNYDVMFDAPADYQDGMGIVIDGTQMLSLTDSNLESIYGAWKEGAPVMITRRGERAFFKTGGVGLNFSFVVLPSASALPTAAAKNRIIGISNIPLPAGDRWYAIGPGTPTVTAWPVGSFWLKTGTVNTYSFNAIKGQNVMYTFPDSLYQRQGANWVLIDGYIDRNTTWQKFSTATVPVVDFNIYTNGVENVPWSVDGAWEKRSSYLYLNNMPQGSYNGAWTTSTVNVSDWNYLNIDWAAPYGSGTVERRVGLSASAGSSDSPSSSGFYFGSSELTFARRTNKIDIRSATGNYRIKSRPATGAASEAQEIIYRVWLSKT